MRQYFVFDITASRTIAPLNDLACIPIAYLQCLQRSQTCFSYLLKTHLSGSLLHADSKAATRLQVRILHNTKCTVAFMYFSNNISIFGFSVLLLGSLLCDSSLGHATRMRGLIFIVVNLAVSSAFTINPVRFHLSCSTFSKITMYLMLLSD